MLRMVVEEVSEAPPVKTEPSDDDLDSETRCWGALLQGDGSRCMPGFSLGKAHFKNKLCESCRAAGVSISANRVRIVRPSCTLRNELKQGLWSLEPSMGQYRLINQTAECKGTPLLLSANDVAPMGPMFGPIPPPLIDAEGKVHFRVSKGTLVPASHMPFKRTFGESAASDMGNNGNWTLPPPMGGGALVPFPTKNKSQPPPMGGMPLPAGGACCTPPNSASDTMALYGASDPIETDTASMYPPTAFAPSVWTMGADNAHAAANAAAAIAAANAKAALSTCKQCKISKVKCVKGLPGAFGDTAAQCERCVRLGLQCELVACKLATPTKSATPGKRAAALRSPAPASAPPLNTLPEVQAVPAWFAEQVEQPMRHFAFPKQHAVMPVPIAMPSYPNAMANAITMYPSQPPPSVPPPLPVAVSSVSLPMAAAAPSASMPWAMPPVPVSMAMPTSLLSPMQSMPAAQRPSTPPAGIIPAATALPAPGSKVKLMAKPEAWAGLGLTNVPSRRILDERTVGSSGGAGRTIGQVVVHEADSEGTECGDGLGAAMLHGPCNKPPSFASVFLDLGKRRPGPDARHFFALAADCAVAMNNSELLASTVHAAKARGMALTEIQRTPKRVADDPPEPILALLKSSAWVNTFGVVAGKREWRMNAQFETHVMSARVCNALSEADQEMTSCPSKKWLPQDEEQNDFMEGVLSKAFIALAPVRYHDHYPCHYQGGNAALPMAPGAANGAGACAGDGASAGPAAANASTELLYAEHASPRSWRLYTPAIQGYTHMRVVVRVCLRRALSGAVDFWVATAYVPIERTDPLLPWAGNLNNVNPALPTPFQSGAPVRADGGAELRQHKVLKIDPPIRRPNSTSPTRLEAAVAAERDGPGGAPSMTKPNLSFSANCHRLVSMRMRRPLDDNESRRVEAALEMGLSIVCTGAAEELRKHLSTEFRTALVDSGPAHLWAAIVDATMEQTDDISDLVTTIVTKCSSVASTDFADGLNF